MAAGQTPKLWRMNLTRLSHEPNEDTSWCVLGDVSSHVPDRFGYLWVDSGGVQNVPEQELQPWVSLFNGRDLGLWRVLKGGGFVEGGELRPRQGQLTMLLDGPGALARQAASRGEPAAGAGQWEQAWRGGLRFSADVYNPRQLRFAFSPDERNERTGFYATFINQINESNVAIMRGWEFWCPPMAFHGTIPQLGPCSMNDTTWYRCQVDVRPDSVRMYLNRQLVVETPNFCPAARYLALHASGEARLRNIRMQRLTAEK